MSRRLAALVTVMAVGCAAGDARGGGDAALEPGCEPGCADAAASSSPTDAGGGSEPDAGASADADPEPTQDSGPCADDGCDGAAMLSCRRAPTDVDLDLEARVTPAALLVDDDTLVLVGGGTVPGAPSHPATWVARVAPGAAPITERWSAADQRGAASTAWLDGAAVVVGGSDYGSGVGDGFVGRIDAAGAWSWRRALGGSAQDAVDDVAPAAVDGYLFVGHRGVLEHAFWLARVASNGSLLWERTYPGGCCWDRASAVVRSPEGFVVAGWRRDGGTAYDARVLRVDEAGDVIFEGIYGSPEQVDRARNVAIWQSEDIVVSGDHGLDGWVARLDGSSGAPRFERVVPTVAHDLELRALAVSEAGWIVVGGSSWHEREAGYLVLFLDGEGGTLARIEGPPGRYLDHLAALPGGRVALFGTRFNETGGRLGVWVQTLSCSTLE